MEKLILGLTHKAFHVTDMEASLRFYRDCLGLQEIFEIKDDQGKDWLMYLKICDKQFIELFYGGTEKRPLNWPQHLEDVRDYTPEQAARFGHQVATHICFEVRDIDACVERLRAFGYDVLPGMEPKEGKDFNIETFVADPDGNLVELMQYSSRALQLMTYPE